MECPKSLLCGVCTRCCARGNRQADLHPSERRWCSCCSLRLWWWGRGGTGREEGRPWSGSCLGSLATRRCCSLRAEAEESPSSTSARRQEGEEMSAVDAARVALGPWTVRSFFFPSQVFYPFLNLDFSSWGTLWDKLTHLIILNYAELTNSYLFLFT